jgi:predicted RNA polymerase sigma factor
MALNGELLNGVYDELHRLTSSFLRNERPNHTLQPSALINEACIRLITYHTHTAVDSQPVNIVELRFFGGLSVEEAAVVIGVSEATVKREWAVVRAWQRVKDSPSGRFEVRMARKFRHPNICRVFELLFNIRRQTQIRGSENDFVTIGAASFDSSYVPAVQRARQGATSFPGHPFLR